MPPLDSPDPDDNLQGHSKYQPGVYAPAEQGDDPTINRVTGERESYSRGHIPAARALESQPVAQGGQGKGDVHYGPDGVTPGDDAKTDVERDAEAKADAAK